MNENDTVDLLMKDIFAVTASKAKVNGKKTENGQGVELHTYTEKEGNRIKYKIIFLAHPSEKLCDAWVEQINVLLKGETSVVIYKLTTLIVNSEDKDFNIMQDAKCY